MVWTLANLFPGCLMKSIDSIRAKKKFFWDQMKLPNRHWLMTNMNYEAYPGVRRVQQQKNHRQGHHRLHQVPPAVGPGSRGQHGEAMYAQAVLAKPSEMSRPGRPTAKEPVPWAYKHIRPGEKKRPGRAHPAPRQPLNVLNIAMMQEINAGLRQPEKCHTLKVLLDPGQGQGLLRPGVDVGEHLGEQVHEMIEVFHGMFRRMDSLGVVNRGQPARARPWAGGCELAALLRPGGGQ